jgi:predicted DCC family thiol-disulfide oxidoreductase YuxK
MTDKNSHQEPWQIKLLYDGDCPLCVREVNFLQQKDAGKGKVAFVNIADEDYSPEENANIDYEQAMNRIHAILPNGAIVTNIEVFRRVYEILGMGWVYSFTKLPLLGTITNKMYELWAYWRLKMTGRPDLITLVNERNKRLASVKKITCQ